MLFNKKNTRKINDKKILHKVGKHWVTLSIAMLATMGIGFAATGQAQHISMPATGVVAHASTTNNGININYRNVNDNNANNTVGKGHLTYHQLTSGTGIGSGQQNANVQNVVQNYNSVDGLGNLKAYKLTNPTDSANDEADVPSNNNTDTKNRTDANVAVTPNVGTATLTYKNGSNQTLQTVNIDNNMMAKLASNNNIVGAGGTLTGKTSGNTDFASSNTSNNLTDYFAHQNHLLSDEYTLNGSTMPTSFTVPALGQNTNWTITGVSQAALPKNTNDIMDFNLTDNGKIIDKVPVNIDGSNGYTYAKGTTDELKDASGNDVKATGNHAYKVSDIIKASDFNNTVEPVNNDSSATVGVNITNTNAGNGYSVNVPVETAVGSIPITYVDPNGNAVGSTTLSPDTVAALNQKESTSNLYTNSVDNSITVQNNDANNVFDEQIAHQNGLPNGYVIASNSNKNVDYDSATVGNGPNSAQFSSANNDKLTVPAKGQDANMAYVLVENNPLPISVDNLLTVNYLEGTNKVGSINLGTNGSNQLTYNGQPIFTGSSALTPNPHQTVSSEGSNTVSTANLIGLDKDPNFVGNYQGVNDNYTFDLTGQPQTLNVQVEPQSQVGPTSVVYVNTDDHDYIDDSRAVIGRGNISAATMSKIDNSVHGGSTVNIDGNSSNQQYLYNDAGANLSPSYVLDISKTGNVTVPNANQTNNTTEKNNNVVYVKPSMDDVYVHYMVKDPTTGSNVDVPSSDISADTTGIEVGTDFNGQNLNNPIGANQLASDGYVGGKQTNIAKLLTNLPKGYYLAGPANVTVPKNDPKGYNFVTVELSKTPVEATVNDLNNAAKNDPTFKSVLDAYNSNKSQDNGNKLISAINNDNVFDGFALDKVENQIKNGENKPGKKDIQMSDVEAAAAKDAKLQDALNNWNGNHNQDNAKALVNAINNNSSLNNANNNLNNIINTIKNAENNPSNHGNLDNLLKLYNLYMGLVNSGLFNN